MISKSVLIMGFGLAKAKSQQAESHLLYPLCTIIDTGPSKTWIMIMGFQRLGSWASKDYVPEHSKTKILRHQKLGSWAFIDKDPEH